MKMEVYRQITGPRSFQDYKEIFLHVGFHRTASTYFQRVILPTVSVDSVIKPDTRYFWSSVVYDPLIFRRSIEAMLPRSGPYHERVVISQETIGGRPEINPPGWPRLHAKRLRDAFPEGRILIVLRNQWDYLESVYAYRVMSRGVEFRSFTNFLRAKLNSTLSSTLQFDRFIEEYAGVFGDSNVLVLFYEHLVNDPQRFLRRLSEFLGVPIPDLQNTYHMNATSRSPYILSMHRSLNIPMWMMSGSIRALPFVGRDGAQEMLRVYCRLKGRLLRFIDSSGKGQSDERLQVDSRELDQINAIIGPSNRRLEALVGEELGPLGYHIDS